MPSPPPLTDTAETEPCAERAEWQLAMLKEVAEICMETARCMGRQAAAQAALDEAALEDFQARRAAGEETAVPPTPTLARRPADAGLTLERIARAVRRILALYNLIDDGRLSAVLKAQAERAAKAAKRRQSLDDRKIYVRHAVQDIVEAQVPRREAAEQLLNDLDLGLEAFADADLEVRSVGEMVARLCQDLGVSFDPVLLGDEEWAVEEIVERPKGSPFADRRIAGLAIHGGPPEPPDPPSPLWGGEEPPPLAAACDRQMLVDPATNDRAAIRVGESDSGRPPDPTPWASMAFPTPDLRSDPPHEGEGGGGASG